MIVRPRAYALVTITITTLSDWIQTAVGQKQQMFCAFSCNHTAADRYIWVLVYLRANAETCQTRLLPCRCLADEADLHAHAQMTPPPLTALRDYSVKMQAQLQEVISSWLNVETPPPPLSPSLSSHPASLPFMISFGSAVLLVYHKSFASVCL